MGVKKLKPTSPGPPMADGLRFRRGHPLETREEPPIGQTTLIGPKQLRSHHFAPSRRRSQAALPDDRLPAHQGRCPRQGRVRRVRPEPQCAHRVAALRGWREALHPRSGWDRGRRQARVRIQGRHPPGQRPSPAQHPHRHDRPRGRASSRRRGQDGPVCRHRDPAHVEGRQARTGAFAFRRDAPGAARLSGHRRTGRQHRGRADQGREGRTDPLEGPATAVPWCRHEPGRPSARRW